MTAHTLYTGVTQSGKTTAARLVARSLPETRPRLVYDPLGTSTLGGDWGEGAQVTDDKDTFLDWVYSEEAVHCDVFIDEAHDIFPHSDKSHLWLLTQGRHYGMRLHIITQRPTKVHPDARSNCGRCFMFRLAFDDAKAIGNDYGHSDIHKINLDKGDFLLLNSGESSYSRSNIFQLLEP